MKLANIQSLVAIKSYSGYLTIDEKTNSNLFFWFFPSQKTPEQDPVILWINQAPGYSSLQGIFVETGPFHVDSESTVTPRNFSWTKSHSMLYIDSPVGTGFSFTDSPEAYANGFDEDGAELCEALKQFFTIFKEFQDREFYLAGEDYAAVFIPSIIKTIEAENAKGGLKINLKGFMVGSPYMDSKQVHNAQTLYNFGLIDKKQKAIMDGQIEKAFKMIENGQAKEGEQLALSISYGPNSLLAKFTGFQDYSNALASKPRPEIAWRYF
ncbi:unnamed protein product [Allacma fusca]|uniref:Serine carboxypeptidase n=1 Tax=Allacma fusca TaxID=39272 RepID=A0A8J2LQA7_9HEXA|nr:unnamed protein product [Allacma fusca]